jgi:ribosomal protein S1
MGMTFEVQTRLVVSTKRPRIIYFYDVGNQVQILYNGKVITGCITEIRQDGVMLDTKERKKYYDFEHMEAIKKEEFEL